MKVTHPIRYLLTLVICYTSEHVFTLSPTNKLEKRNTIIPLKKKGNHLVANELSS